MCDSDKVRQEDELEVLQSIYPQELEVKTRWPFSGSLKISPSILNDDFPVKVTTKVAEKSEIRVLKIKHLPPIELFFLCPPDYPSKSQPFFLVSCVWLPDCQLAEICHKLDSLWDGYESEILFAWASFLKEDCCAFLHLEELQITLDMDLIKQKPSESEINNPTALCSNDDSTKPKFVDSIFKEYGAKTLNVKPLNEHSYETVAKTKGNNSRQKNKVKRKGNNDDIFKYETPKDIKDKEKHISKQSCASVCDKPIQPESSKKDNPRDLVFNAVKKFGHRRKLQQCDTDSRILPKKPEEITRVVKTIEDFNDRILETEFRTVNHSCEVCFEEKPGSNCIYVRPCRHIFCKNCVKDYLTMHISNSNVGALRCLQYDCDSSFSHTQIRENIDDETYTKYRKFSLKFAVESDPNLLYCPREICQSVARISSLSQDMCHCESCGFYFCIYCKKAYHGVEMCDLKSEERLKVIREYQEASDERKLELEKRFTKNQLLKWVENDLSQKWLEECSKPCPNCRAVIQKVDGCNKMMCLNCNTPFCWLCNLCLSRTQPYKHFIDPQSPCYQKLFPPEEMEEMEEEGDFEDEEDEDEHFFALVDEMLLNVHEDVLPYYFID